MRDGCRVRSKQEDRPSGGGRARNRIAVAERLLVLLHMDETWCANGGKLEELPPEIKDWLGEMAASETVTAGIFSGRAVDDLMTTTGLEHIVFAGNHGNEIRGMGLHYVEPVAFLCEPILRELVDEMNERLRDAPFARMENKRFTATLHLRGAARDERQSAVEALGQAMLGRDRLRLISAKESIEILPNNGWDIADAVGWIVSRLGLDDAMVVSASEDLAVEAFNARRI